MSIYYTCEYPNCSFIAELCCSCGYKSCQNHYGCHYARTSDENHFPEKIASPLSEDEVLSFRSLYPVNVLPLIEHELEKKRIKTESLRKRIEKIDEEHSIRIQNFLKMQKYINYTLSVIQKYSIVPLKSEHPLANCLGTLKRNNSLSRQNINERINLELSAIGSESISMNIQFAGSIEISSKYSQAKLLKEFKDHSDVVNCLAVSPCLRMIASGSDDKKVIVRRTDTGEILHSIKAHKERVLSLDFSPDSNSLVSSGGDSTIKVWNLLSRNRGKKLKGHSNPALSVIFSISGNLVASGGFDQYINIYSTSKWTQKYYLTGHENAVTSMRFCNGDQSLVSGSLDRTIKLWDLQSKTIVQSFKTHTENIWAIDVFQNFVVSVGEDLKVILSNFHLGRYANSFHGHNEPINSVAFSPCGNFMVSGGESIRIWTRTGYYMNIKTDSRVFGVKFLSNKIVSCHKDKTIRIWDCGISPQT